MASIFDSYAPVKGRHRPPEHRLPGLFETGESVTYGLFNAQERGVLFIGAGVPVYAGHGRGRDPQAGRISASTSARRSSLTNMRSSGADDALRLVTPRTLSLEQCLEFLADDELLEVTPEACACASGFLDHGDRMKALKGGQK